MGLETATFVNGLTASWPLAGDKKNQGDDHLRLIKSVLQATFPNANKAFRFPVNELITGTITLDATDQNNTVMVDTSSGNIALTLPTGLGAGDTGLQLEIMKYSTDANAVIVSPPAGTIWSAQGAVATVRVGVLCEPVTFKWNGGAWVSCKYGIPVGTSIDYNGSNVPAGYLLEDGASFSNTAFAELFAALGSSVLKDKRGRTTIGDGTGSGLTARVLGTNYGEETHLLTTGEIPSHTHANSLNDPGHSHNVRPSAPGGVNQLTVVAGSGVLLTSGITDVQTTGITITNAAAGGGGSHNNMQPSQAVKKLIRAC